MSAGRLDILIEQGSYFLLNVTVVLWNAALKTWEPFNMLGYTLAAQVRTAKGGAGTLLATMDSSWVDQANGKFSLSIAHTVTATMPNVPHVPWDLFIIDSLSKPQMFFEGKALIRQRTTVVP